MGVHELFNHVYFEFCKAHLFNLFLKMIEFRTAYLIYISYLNQIPDLINSVKLLQISQLNYILYDPASKFNIYIKAFLTQFFKPFKVFNDDSNISNVILLFKASLSFMTIYYFFNNWNAAFFKIIANQIKSFAILYFLVLMKFLFILIIIILIVDLLICR